MKQMEKPSPRELADLFWKFFNSICNLVRSRRLVQGNMDYLYFMPPWLRKPTLFIHGTNRNRSIDLFDVILPRKISLRELWKKN